MLPDIVKPASDYHFVVKLTEKIVKRANPKDRIVEYHDEGQPGLYLLVLPSGTKTWRFRYYKNGTRRDKSLGIYPWVSVDLASTAAAQLHAAKKRGEDPVEDEKKAKEDNEFSNFEKCMEAFIQKHVKGKELKSAKSVESILRRYALPRWGDKSVKDIKLPDVVSLLEEVAENKFKTQRPKERNGEKFRPRKRFKGGREHAKGKGHQAYQLRQNLSKMFNWLLARGRVEVNPVTGTDVSDLVDLTPRTRILSDVELVAFWKATFKLDNERTPDIHSPYGHALRVLLLTGMRLREVADLRWKEIEGSWALLPKTRMKNGRDFKAPLSALAKSTIESVPVRIGDFVFTTTGKRGLGNWGHVKERVDELMALELGAEKVEEWRFHDLRRTMATGVAMLGTRREVIDRLLAHVPQKSDVTNFVYNRFMYDDEAMEAVTKWAAHVLKLVSGLEVVKATA